MADAPAPGMPEPPAGMQRPGLPGAGNLLDPQVRGQIREAVHAALHDLVRRAAGNPAAADAPAPADQPGAERVERPGPPSSSPPAAATTATDNPPGQRNRAGPYPHGDVDLSFIAANVPSEPVRPIRARAPRRFYFLADTKAASAPTPSSPPLPPATDPKPG